MKIMKMHGIGLLALLLAAGCATPKIDAAKFAAPRSVVIDDIPDMNLAATIRIVTLNWPKEYFSARYDSFFLLNGAGAKPAAIADNSEQINQIVTNQIVNSPRPVSVGRAGAMGAVGGAVGGLIQGIAEETEKKAGEFPGLLRKTMPGADLRADFKRALRQSLEAKGITVRIAGETRNLPPRLHWPAKDEKGETLATGALADSPAVDADLLVQVVPIAVYASPGPLNSYSRTVGVGLAMFNGRTRQFIGWQAFRFQADGSLTYSRYDSLVADIERAGPALHGALLSLVPQVAEVIGGKGH